MTASTISSAKWPADVAVPVRPVPDRSAIAARHAAAPVPLEDTTGAFFVTAERLGDWAIDAEEGARCVYARGTGLAYKPRLRDYAQLLAHRGIIEICAKRHAEGDGLFDFIARRRGVAYVKDEAQVELSTADALPAPTDAAPLTGSALLVFDLVARRADQGAPLDSNRGIANATGLKDADAAAYQLRVLRQRGLILLKPVPVEPGRVATVVETGAQTGLIGR